MPYRRLPNTDAARIKALSTAIEKSSNLHPDELAFSYATLQKAKFFLSTYKQSLHLKKSESRNQTEKGAEYAQAFKKLKMYVSHFIHVLQFCVQREEMQPQVLNYYNLQSVNKTLPELRTDQQLIDWAQTIIQGEDKRIMEGGTPMLNPRIALVKIHVTKFIEAQRNHSVLAAKNERAVGFIDELRTEAHEIIVDIWNQVEAKFKDLPASERRLRAEEYGVKYVFRKSEILKNSENGQ